MSAPKSNPVLKTYRPVDPAYRRAAAKAARQAIQEWLGHVECHSMHFFEVEGVQCALEFFSGHWGDVAPYGMVEGGRWRWGRLDAGDPDEDESGEDVLLEVALGGPLLPEPPQGRRRRLFPPFTDTDITVKEIRTHALAHAKEHLSKIVLRRLPSA